MQLAGMKQRGIIARVMAQLRRLAVRMVPLQKDVKYIAARFGGGYGAFFLFARYLVFQQGLVLLVYLPLVLPQMADYAPELPTRAVWTAKPLLLFGGFYRVSPTWNPEDTSTTTL